MPVSALGGGPAWRKRFRRHEAPRFASSGRPLPVFGANHGAPWALVNSAVGPLAGYRGYNTAATGVPASWPGPDVDPTILAQVAAPGTIISFAPNITQVLAGTLDTQLATLFSTVPAGAYVSFWHEAETGGWNSFMGTTITQANLIAAHTRVWGIFSQYAPQSASYGQIVAGASAFSPNNGYPLGPWCCTTANGGTNLDFYGIDMGAGTNQGTFAGAYNTVTTAMIAAGVPAAGPWTFPEAGIATGWLGPNAQWFSDGWNVACAAGAIHYMPFFGPFATSQSFWPPGSGNTTYQAIQVLQDIGLRANGVARPAAAQTPARSATAPLVAGSTTTLTATFSPNPAAGSKVLVAVGAGHAAVFTSVADNGTTPSAFTFDGCCLTTGSAPAVFLFRADNITLPATGSYTVTVTKASGGLLEVAACAYTGVQNGPPLASSAIIGTSSQPALYPVSPADASSLLFSAFFCDSATNPESFATATPVFTIEQTQTAGGTYSPGAVSDALITSALQTAGGWTLPDAPDWAAVMAAYSAFPATVTIQPGAQACYAQSPQPAAQVTVNAGLASATGTAGTIYPGHNAGLASASGWAAVNAPGTVVTPGAGAATGAALAPVADVSGVDATGATGSGAALFSGTAAVSLTLTAINPVGAVAAVLQAVAQDGVTPGAAAAAGAALAPGPVVAVTAGLPAATGAANTPALGFTPGLPAATGAALAPVPDVIVTAGLPAATGAALTPTVITGVAANAGLAAATGAALAAAANVQATPGTAAATGTAQPVAHGATPGLASASAAGQQPAATVAPAAATAASTGHALTASGTPVTGLAAATGSAQLATLTLAAQATAAQALSAALGATATTVAVFTVGALTASTAPQATLTAATAAAGTGEYGGVYGPDYGPQEGTLTATSTRTGGPQ